MFRRLLLLFLLVNVVGVAANLPRIIGSLDGASIGRTVASWTVGVGTATGDLLDEIAAETPTAAEVLDLQTQLRDDTLTEPLDDEHVASLVELWRVLEDAGEQVEADELRRLLLDEGVDVTDEGLPEMPGAPTPSP